MVHELIYAEEGSKAASQVGMAAEELATTLKAVREGDGIAHDLLFGGEGSDSAEAMLTNLAAVTSDLKGVTGQIKDGKGTLGALLNDPSVYEDLKVLLGNVAQNQRRSRADTTENTAK